MLHRAAAVTVRKIELTIETKNHSVHAVIRVNSSKSGQEGIAFIRLVVSIRIFKDEQIWAVAHENAAPLIFTIVAILFLDGDSHRNRKDLIGENGRLICLAVA